ncbi:MAG: hypothetical protein QW587_05555 [Candidatus Bathyarchaeia archaeon]
MVVRLEAVPCDVGSESLDQLCIEELVEARYELLDLGLFSRGGPQTPAWGSPRLDVIDDRIEVFTHQSRSLFAEMLNESQAAMVEDAKPEDLFLKLTGRWL